MNFEILKRKHLKRNIIIGCFAVLILTAIILTFTRANYRNTQSIPLASGTINYTPYDLNVVAMTIDGETAKSLPEGKFELTEESYCTVNGEKDESIEILYDTSSQKLMIDPITNQGTKCYLDFVTLTTKTVDTVLGQLEVYLRTPDFMERSCTIGTNNGDDCEDNIIGIYEAEDDLGTSYYYRGNVENNYLKFAGYYWRIIRINGDGSVRVIYDGVRAYKNGYASEFRDIGTSYWDSARYNDISYGGYTYTTGQLRPSTKNGGTNSEIKNFLENWYNENLQQYDSMIVSTPGFCNDRTSTGSTNMPDSLWNLTLKCSNNLDLYTTKIGLITIPEVGMAGLREYNQSVYLYTGQSFWTMTPSFLTASNINNPVIISSEGGWNVVVNGAESADVRPVINISSSVTITGSGTINDPYVVEGAE